MMGVVTESLVQLIAKQVDEKGLVVWYDPEQAYGAAAAALYIPNTTVARYEGSFLKLRHEIDHLLNDTQPPRLVVYVPLEQTETHSALIELDCAGAVMRPRQQPPACNTRLSVVARNALKSILGEDQVTEIERQVDAGKLSLADLDSLADKGKDISTGVLTLIFGSANPQEVALAFLHSDRRDEEIRKKDAAKDLRHLLQVSFGIELPAGEALPDWRVRIGRHTLLTDLFAALKNQVPPPSPRSPWLPARAASMLVCDWLEHGETAGMCGTATWPWRTRSNRTLPSASLTCPCSRSERTKPFYASSEPCWCMWKANWSSRRPRHCFNWPGIACPDSGPTWFHRFRPGGH